MLVPPGPVFSVGLWFCISGAGAPLTPLPSLLLLSGGCSPLLSLSLPHPLQGSHGMQLFFHHPQNCEHTLSAPPRTSSSDLCLLMPVTPEVLRPAEKLSGGRVGTVYSSEMPFSCSLNSVFFKILFKGISAFPPEMLTVKAGVVSLVYLWSLTWYLAQNEHLTRILIN